MSEELYEIVRRFVVDDGYDMELSCKLVNLYFDLRFTVAELRRLYGERFGELPQYA